LCRSAPRGKPRVRSVIPLDPWDQGRPERTGTCGGPFFTGLFAGIIVLEASPIHLEAEKSALRGKMRQSRRAFAGEPRRLATAAFTTQALSSGWFQTGQCMAAYCAVASELDLAPLLQQLLARGLKLCLPVVDDQGGMQFLRYQGEELLPGAHAISRPHPGSEIIVPAQIELLLPLLAFDARGNRLGQGGGYFDRFLSQCSVRPKCVGVAFAMQEVVAVPIEVWDQRLDAVITDRYSRSFP
jgi:5-formyltetrahydrofolate cyclo-ligase